MILFIIIISATVLLMAGANYLLYHTIVTSYNFTSAGLLNFIKIMMFLLPVGFIAASILIDRFASFLVRAFYVICSYWLGVLLYFTIACLMLYLILFLNKFFLFNLNIKILTSVLLLAALAVTTYGVFASQNIKIKKIEVALPNLPSAWKDKTAIFVSDLHLGAVDNYEFAARLAYLINGLKPDILLIGGDFFDGQKNIDLLQLARTFSAIEAPLGKFFVTGNHEEFGDSAKFTEALAQAGITNLNNQLIEINGLQLVGVDYMTAYSQNNFAKILAGLKIDKNKPSVLLRHVPDKINVAEGAGVSLMLSGHTHSGQLFPAELVTRLLYGKYSYGLHNYGQTLVFTSNGVGTWGPPMRVLADPEIVQIKFK